MDVAAARQRIRVGVTMPPSQADPRATMAQIQAGGPAPRRTAPTEAQIVDFCEALAEATGTVVTPHAIPSYRELVEAMDAGHIDVAWMPPVAAMRATSRGKALPVALPVRDGTAYYSTALFTRPDSAVRSLDRLRGARAAWVDRHSAAGYLVIRASLRMRGVDVDRAFSAETFYGSHDAVARAVLEGEADVGASYVLLDPRRSKPTRAGWGDAAVRMLATAGPIPGDVIAVSIRVPVATIRLVQRALLSPPSDAMRRAAGALFAAEGFEEASSEHLEPLSALLGHMDDRFDSSPNLPPYR